MEERAYKGGRQKQGSDSQSMGESLLNPSFFLPPAPQEENHVTQRGRKWGDRCALRKVQAGNRKRDLSDLEGGGGDGALPGMTIRAYEKTQGRLTTGTKATTNSPPSTLPPPAAPFSGSKLKKQIRTGPGPEGVRTCRGDFLRGFRP